MKVTKLTILYKLISNYSIVTPAIFELNFDQLFMFRDFETIF